MNLQPFYELRERLIFAAAAGTQLIADDFRLREAGRKIEVYAKASPVFAKISQMAGKLSGETEEGRGETLLELLGLLDAFLITQGQSRIEGEIKDIQRYAEKTGYTDYWENREGEQKEELPSRPFGEYRNIPYSKLYPLQTALTSTGGGRQSLLSEAYREEPEWFSDFRIRPLLVQALSDSYGEIADMVCEWVMKIGDPMIPLLKEGFLPDGKKDMVRRVKAIGAIAKGRENGFYREYLEDSKKDVREALICALHYHQDNLELLLDLLKTEKGKLKQAVLWSLSFMEGEEAYEFWKKHFSADTSRTALLIKNSHASYIPFFLAGALKKEAENLMKPETVFDPEKDSEGQEKGTKGKTLSAGERKAKEEQRRSGFLSLLDACTGRTEAEIRQVLEWLAGEQGLKSFRKDIAWMMTETVFSAYCPDDKDSQSYEELADRLLLSYGDYSEDYIQPVFAAALLSRPSGQVYEEFAPCFEDKRKDRGTGIFRVMQRISYEPDKGYVIYPKNKTDYQMEIYERGGIRVLEKGLDLRWYPLLMKYKFRCPKSHPAVYTPYSGCDAVLYRLKRRDIPELRRAYNEYFYARAMQEGPSSADVAILKENGWTDFKGFVEKSCERFKNTAWAYRIRELIRELPVDREQLIQELESVKKSWEGKKINGSSLIDRWLEQLRNGAAVSEIV